VPGSGSLIRIWSSPTVAVLVGRTAMG